MTYKKGRLEPITSDFDPPLLGVDFFRATKYFDRAKKRTTYTVSFYRGSRDEAEIVTFVDKYQFKLNVLDVDHPSDADAELIYLKGLFRQRAIDAQR